MTGDWDQEGARRAMIDLEAQERKLLGTQGKLPPNPRVCRYKPGEKRFFDSVHDIPAGEGWSDDRSVFYQKPQIESVAAVSQPEAPRQPEELPAAGEPPRRPGRKPRK